MYYRRYGTGAIMAVPAHDDKRLSFAKKFDLPIIEVIEGGNVEEAAIPGEGKHINSGELDGLENEAAITKAYSIIREKGAGERKLITN